VGDNRDGFRLAAVYARVNAVRALVSAHRGILVFLQPLPETVEFRCYCCVCLGYLLFEGRVPAEVNQGRDDQNFSQ
jgi:hypothetical protein